MQLLAKQIGPEGGEIAILSATPNATNQNTWIEFMEDELSKPEYSKFKLVKTAYGNDDDQKSFEETQGLLQAYPDLKGIISPTTVGIAAAARYLQGSDAKGKVKLTGLGTPNQLRDFVKDGTIEGFELWDPGQLGYLAAYAAGALASGTITGAEGEKFTAGDLGERDDRRQGRDPPRPADRVRQGQHRRLRLLVVSSAHPSWNESAFRCGCALTVSTSTASVTGHVWPEMLAALSATGWTQLLAVPAARRAADRLPRDRRFRGRQAGDGGDGRERTLAGGDGAVLRRRARLRAAGGGVPP